MSADPLFSDELSALIFERCLTRAAGYARNHSRFNSTSEMYFFLGAVAVLDSFSDPAAKALADGWLHDLVSEKHKPRDLSDKARRARRRSAPRRAEFAKILRMCFSASAGATVEKLDAVIKFVTNDGDFDAGGFVEFLDLETDGKPVSDAEMVDLLGRYDAIVMGLEIEGGE